MSVFGDTDLYKLLELESDADTAAIEKAYKKLARAYHPDRAGGSKDLFQAVQEAHEVLHVKERRDMYEEARKQWLFNLLTFDEQVEFRRSERLKAESAAEAQAVLAQAELRSQQLSSAQGEIQAAAKERWDQRIAEREASKLKEEEAAEQLRAKRQRRREKKAAAAAALTHDSSNTDTPLQGDAAASGSRGAAKAVVEAENEHPAAAAEPVVADDVPMNTASETAPLVSA